MKKTFNFIFFAVASLVLTLSACSSEAESSSNETIEISTAEIQVTEQGPNGNAVQTDKSNGVDFYDWTVQMSVDKSAFADIAAGSEIKITTTKSKKCTFNPWEYYNLKLHSGDWKELTGGSVTGATNNGVIVPNSPNGTIVYKVTEANAKALKENGLVMIGYGLCVTDIKIVKGSGSSNSGNGGTTPSTPTENTVWSGNKEFNDTGWKINLEITADKFASFKNGSQIKIEWHELSGAGYKKLQLDSAGSSWVELTGGSISGGEKESGANSNGIKLTSSPTIYTVTESNAAALKANGLAIMGYGAVVTKISLISEGGATGGNSGNGGNNGSTGTTPSVPDISEIETKVEPTSVTGTPYANHGKLSVKDGSLIDKNGEAYMLYGMSTHGLNFGNDFNCYVNKDAFKTLVDDWNTNCIRLVMYPGDYQGYCNGGDKAALKQIMKNGIEYATELGIYVLVDWHVHNFNPNERYKDDAKLFLAEFAKEYANYGNVLYEICNEPTGAPWDSAIKPYAEEVIPCIREYAKDAVVIVGTNTWSQDIGDAYNNPLDPATYGNIMYTFHFYAGSHSGLYDRVEDYAKKGLPIFITEFGTCDASGNGGFNATESQKWFDLCKTYKISHMNWSLCNKGETASAILSSCSKTSGWDFDDLTASGRTVVNHFKTLER